ncbi:hypothetical protein Arub01_11640 [Actinomadura rubrobrunea]|uniref:Nucleoside 2-deoxyribosyltransferase n=1 Tax=Actinomadura rubrobrunea TaxID=115335 RepID=A0A9W6PR20_9ACTN|nr:nucleoside 2-deoxyribosyltransferase [Actinomadura rubrobrunea]GLW62920.1 hypothetical protein Arub01_11640 [Actinomadura rubrobrunea]
MKMGTTERKLFVCYALEGEPLEELQERLELISMGAQDAGFKTYAHIRDAQGWRLNGTPVKEVLEAAFAEIRNADAVLLDLTSSSGRSRRVGLNIEAGYAKALGKPILALWREPDRPNKTTDLADHERSYEHMDQIRRLTGELLSEINVPSVTTV